MAEEPKNKFSSLDVLLIDINNFDVFMDIKFLKKCIEEVKEKLQCLAIADVKNEVLLKLTTFIEKCICEAAKQKYTQMVENNIRKALLYKFLSYILSLKSKVEDSENSDFVSLLQNIVTSSLKATNLWISNNDIEEAELSVNMATNVLEQLQNVKVSKNLFTKQQESHFEYSKLISFIYKAEIFAKKQKYEMSLYIIKDLCEKVQTFPNQQKYVVLLCYNIGVHCFKQGKYSDSILWLRQSYELGKGGYGIDSKYQECILKCLSVAYLKWDGNLNWSKALHALELAFVGNITKEYIIKRLYTVVVGGQQQSIQEVLKESLNWEGINIGIVLTMLSLLLDFNERPSALYFIQCTYKKFGIVPQIECLYVIELKMHLEDGNFHKAKEVVTQFLSFKEGANNITPSVILSVFALLLNDAKVKFANFSFEESLEWYLTCSSLSKTSSCLRNFQQMSWLQRQICFCYIELGDLPKAKLALNECKTLDKNSVMNYYLSIKLAVLMEDEEAAMKDLEDLDFCLSPDHSDELQEIANMKKDSAHILVNTCHFAWQEGKSAFATRLLEKLLSRFSIESLGASFSLTALQCLLQLYVENYERNSLDKIMIFVDKAEQCLKEMQKECP